MWHGGRELAVQACYAGSESDVSPAGMTIGVVGTSTADE